MSIPFPTKRELLAAQANGRRNAVGAGCSDAIREVLEVAERDLDLDEICARLPDYTREQVTHNLRAMVDRTGGVMSIGKRPQRYCLYEPAPARPENVTPPPLRDASPRPLDRDPFEIMKLAMLTRRA
jgi:hypothetical protein